jgi:hypothetical protein
VGEEGGVRPDPEDGSSAGGETTLCGELDKVASGNSEVISAESTETVDVEAPLELFDSSSNIRDMTIFESRIRSRMAIPYGEYVRVRGENDESTSIVWMGFSKSASE